MAPKPRPARRISSAGNAPPTSSPSKPGKNAAMLPPPVPPPPLGILEPEINAISTCLRNAVVKTGQIYSFYSDAQNLGVQQYAARPPRTLTASLGREIEKYDQLCDAMESQLLRAIAVLQRDLAREERRIEMEAKEAAEESAAPSSQVAELPPSTFPGVVPQSISSSEQPSEASTSKQGKTPASTPLRRQSTISLSSLHRPAFPHKLDLSASALRINPEEVLPSGLSSPVTLAPKSARASVPPDINFALDAVSNRPVDIDLDRPVDIDLTVPDAELDLQAVGTSEMAAGGSVNDPALGSSADKPIELDFDMDMFSDSTGSGGSMNGPMQSLFDEHAGRASSNPSALAVPKVEAHDLSIEMFDSLRTTGDSGTEEDIFKSLDAAPAPTRSQLNDGSGPSRSASSSIQPIGAPAPSPGSLMASLGTTSSQSTAVGATPFDFNMDFTFDPAFLGTSQSAQPDINLMEMQNYFNLAPSDGQATKQSTQPP